MSNEFVMVPGEPVAWMRKDGVVFHTAFLDQFGSEYKTRLQPLYTRADPGEVERIHQAWQAKYDEVLNAGEECNRLIDTLRAQLAEQHQGEPVAVFNIDSTGYRVKVLDHDRLPMDGTKLYTHADPGVVERHIARRMELAEQITEMHRQIKQLRAEKAERDSLLKEAVSYMRGGRIAATSEADMIGIFDLRQRIDAALSASTEPSAPGFEDAVTLGHFHPGDGHGAILKWDPIDHEQKEVALSWRDALEQCAELLGMQCGEDLAGVPEKLKSALSASVETETALNTARLVMVATYSLLINGSLTPLHAQSYSDMDSLKDRIKKALNNVKAPDGKPYLPKHWLGNAP